MGALDESIQQSGRHRLAAALADEVQRLQERVVRDRAGRERSLVDVADDSGVESYCASSASTNAVTTVASSSARGMLSLGAGQVVRGGAVAAHRRRFEVVEDADALLDDLDRDFPSLISEFDV